MEGYLFVLTSPIVLPKFTNEKKLSLKKLPKPGLKGYGVIYAYNEKNELVFLYSDGKNNAVKYDIEKDIHRQIKSSKSIDVRGSDQIGLRMGKYLWIIGGSEQFNSGWRYKALNKTILSGQEAKVQRWASEVSGPGNIVSNQAITKTILWVQFFLQIRLSNGCTKGQLISKCHFGVFNFFQKTNENK